MKKTCFFISRIAKPDSEERRASDKLLKFIVGPVLEQLGYETPVRADQITIPGTITTQVFELLWSADLVIADLTGHNANVFYELAARHLSKRPFVHMIQAGETPPFDLAAERTMFFDFDVANVEEAKETLTEMVKSAEGQVCQTVLSMAVDFTAGKDDTATVQKVIITDILSRLQEIQAAFQSHEGIPAVFGLPMPYRYGENAVIFNTAD
jgi:hypothetical protein